jgi:ComEC/Rec2-related protein
VFGLVLNPIRVYIDRLLTDFFDGEGYAVASGLALGGSGRLDPELKEVFSRAGILHILAVSGLHVGFVGAFFGIILLFIPMGQRAKYLIMMCGLLMYAGVTGFRPSVCRATLMASLFGLAMISQRNVDGVHIVNISAISFLLVNPMLLFDVGAQLSFAAVYGILYLFPKIENGYIKTVHRRPLKVMLRMMAVSFSAQVFVAPLLICYFNRLSIYAVIANLVIIPVASATIFMLFLCFSTGWLWFDLARMIAYPAGVLINVLIALSNFFARMPFSALNLSISPLILFPLYLLLGKSIRKYALWSLMVIALLFSLSRSVNCLTVCSASRGILIVMPDDTKVFISGRVSAAQRVFLQKKGIAAVDYLVARVESYPVQKQFIDLPGHLHFVELTCGELRVNVSDRVQINFGKSELEYAWSELDAHAADGKIRYVLSNGRRERVIECAAYGTVIEQMIFDLRLMIGRLSLLL